MLADELKPDTSKEAGVLCRQDEGNGNARLHGMALHQEHPEAQTLGITVNEGCVVSRHVVKSEFSYCLHKKMAAHPEGSPYRKSHSSMGGANLVPFIALATEGQGEPLSWNICPLTDSGRACRVILLLLFLIVLAFVSGCSSPGERIDYERLEKKVLAEPPINLRDLVQQYRRHENKCPETTEEIESFCRRQYDVSYTSYWARFACIDFSPEPNGVLTVSYKYKDERHDNVSIRHGIMSFTACRPREDFTLREYFQQWRNAESITERGKMDLTPLIKTVYGENRAVVFSLLGPPDDPESPDDMETASSWVYSLGYMGRPDGYEWMLWIFFDENGNVRSVSLDD